MGCARRRQRRIAALLALGDALNGSYHAVRLATVPLG
jgi:hypothetical protein